VRKGKDSQTDRDRRIQLNSDFNRREVVFLRNFFREKQKNRVSRKSCSTAICAIGLTQAVFLFPQRLNRRKLGGFPGGIDAENHSHSGRKTDRHQNG
jgi:hypothetical protein